MAKDPVCGMDVDEATAQWTSEYEGKTFYFCAPGCKKSFDEDPARYAAGAGMHGMHGEHGHHGHGHS